MHLSPYSFGGECAGGQFDRERGRAWQVVVLPVRRGSVQPVAVVEAHSRGAGIDAAGGRARAPGPDEVQVLMEPDGDARSNAEDQVSCDPRLPL